MRQPLTATEAAALAGVSRQALNGWLRDGLLPGERRGRWWFVDRYALEKFLRGRGRDGSVSPEPGGPHANQSEPGAGQSRPAP